MRGKCFGAVLVEDREGELDEGTGGAVLVELTGVVFEEGTGAVAGASDVLAANRGRSSTRLGYRLKKNGTSHSKL